MFTGALTVSVTVLTALPAPLTGCALVLPAPLKALPAPLTGCVLPVLPALSLPPDEPPWSTSELPWLPADPLPGDPLRLRELARRAID